jgi:hypothetical protein
MASVKKSDFKPKTANLLACKQWWKAVCLMHGNQEKYYRQVYGQAAAQRVGKSDIKENVGPNLVFPTKNHSPVMITSDSRDTFKLNNLPKNRKQKIYSNSDLLFLKCSVNVLDDPFLFGIDHIDHGSDSGIDANCTNTIRSNTDQSFNKDGVTLASPVSFNRNLTPPPLPPKSSKILNYSLNQHKPDNE